MYVREPGAKLRAVHLRYFTKANYFVWAERNFCHASQ